jgi:hypothetical protein
MSKETIAQQLERRRREEFAAGQRDIDRAMVELVNWLVMHATEPCNWPLTYEEQVSFVRQAIAKGLKIKNEPTFALKRAALMAKETKP